MHEITLKSVFINTPGFFNIITIIPLFFLANLEFRVKGRCQVIQNVQLLVIKFYVPEGINYKPLSSNVFYDIFS